MIICKSNRVGIPTEQLSGISKNRPGPNRNAGSADSADLSTDDGKAKVTARIAIPADAVAAAFQKARCDVEESIRLVESIDTNISASQAPTASSASSNFPEQDNLEKLADQEIGKIIDEIDRKLKGLDTAELKDSALPEHLAKEDPSSSPATIGATQEDSIDGIKLGTFEAPSSRITQVPRNPPRAHWGSVGDALPDIRKVSAPAFEKSISSVEKFQARFGTSSPSSTIAVINKRLSTFARNGVAATLLIGCVAVIVASVTWSSDTSGEDIAKQAALEGGSRIQQANELVETFLTATSPAERASLVLGGATMESRLAEYEARTDRYTFQPLQKVSRREIVSVNGRDHAIIQGETIHSDLRLFFVDLTRESTPKLNWEATVGYDQMPYDEFRLTQPYEPQLMRVLIEPDDYYNHAYSDASEYASYKVRDHKNSVPISAYTQRDSEAYHALSKLFGYLPSKPRVGEGMSSPKLDNRLRTGPRRVTIKLTYKFPQDISDQSLILGVYGEDWVADEEIDRSSSGDQLASTSTSLSAHRLSL